MPNHSSFALVDCRPAAAFYQGHHRNAINIPAAELSQRLHELPKRNQILQLCGDPASLVQAHTTLSSKGYEIQQSLEWNTAYADQLMRQGLLQFGISQVRLWNAGGLVQRFVQAIAIQYAIQPGKGLDLACGAGRDTVYLALHGWQMTGVDYLPGAIQRTQQLAQQQQVAVNTLLLDLENSANPFTHCGLAKQSFDLICVARYLHRPLLPLLPSLLAPGGVLLYQTFMQGSEQFGSPRNPNYLLRPHELAQTFAGLTILLDEVEYLEDGRPLSAFIARRPL